MKPEDRIPLRFGQGNVDWQQRINWEELRKKRVDRAQKFMGKWGIGSAIVFNHDRRRYLSSVWTHPMETLALQLRSADQRCGVPLCACEEKMMPHG